MENYMLIDQVFPQVVEAKSDMQSCLLATAKDLGCSDEEIGKILSSAPTDLLAAECFLDKMTKLWRYEYGLPSNLPNTNQLLWGTHMWLPVRHLLEVLICAHRRLSEGKLNEYLPKLADPEKHRDHLAEMMPILRLGADIPTDFEVPGYGTGNTTVDWRIGPIDARLILLDAKNRMGDLYVMMDQDNVQNPPSHDSALLFRSIEKKFQSADPCKNLQGGWINTQVKQERNALLAAFNKLDGNKVHFIILGDEKEDAYILTKRPEDEIFLRKTLKMLPSERFIYDENTATKSG